MASHAQRRRRITTVAAAVVVVAGSAGFAAASVSGGGPAYRLAIVTTADVTAVLHAVGTVAPAQQADISFPVAGTVATVPVSAGAHVTAGQVLGTLDPTALDIRIAAAQVALATAQVKVAADTANQATTLAPAEAAAAPTVPTAVLQRLQQRVLSAQRAADAAVQLARNELDRATHLCPTGTTAASPSPQPTTTATSPLTGCADAQQQVLAQESATLRTEQALTAEVAALQAALTKAAAALESAGRTTGSTPAHAQGASSGGPVSAAQLAADQATVDADAAAVTAARQAAAATTVTSPITGTVVTVAVAPGDAAPAGRTAFVVAELSRFDVQTEIPVASIATVKPGQPATVQPDGGTPLSGHVAAVGVLPTTGGSATTYPVTIALDRPTVPLHAGAGASVAITTARAAGITVPTSAVHALGRFATVTVYANGNTRQVPVTLGTQSPTRTQVVAGLRAGEQVVLAELHRPLPANTVVGRFGGGGFRGTGRAVRPTAG